jgi:hypothetical protein
MGSITEKSKVETELETWGPEMGEFMNKRTVGSKRPAVAMVIGHQSFVNLQSSILVAAGSHQSVNQ